MLPITKEVEEVTINKKGCLQVVEMNTMCGEWWLVRGTQQENAEFDLFI